MLVLPVLAGVAFAIWDTVPETLRLVPSGLSLLAWAAFQFSLRRGATPLVERFAARQHSPMPDLVRHYCRRVTWAWAILLLANTIIAALLAFWGSLQAWAIYTGVISYLLMGALALGERWWTRPRVHARLAAERAREAEGLTR